jgi:hypothetical protein
MSKLEIPGLMEASRMLEARAAEYRALNRGEIGNRIAAELRDMAEAMRRAAGMPPRSLG